MQDFFCACKVEIFFFVSRWLIFFSVDETFICHKPDKTVVLIHVCFTLFNASKEPRLLSGLFHKFN